MLRLLDQMYPKATCALTHRNPWELLVATILSAQCTDKRVNEVTPGLFAKYPTPADFAAVRPEVLALRAIGDGAVCTINALQPQQHTGSGGNSYGRPGRIAGSVNVPAAHLLDPDSNTFLPADELREHFETFGDKLPDELAAQLEALERRLNAAR
ncbi:hypothetical protein B4Q13_20065 [Lacticaseibacillus rhamnosus]